MSNISRPCVRCGIRPKVKSRGHKYCAECSAMKKTGVELQADRHGLSIEQYNELLAEQGGRCAICGVVPDRPFAIDHDHKCCPGVHSCGKCVRGLLCNNCNTGIGMMADDPARLRSAANYLEGR